MIRRLVADSTGFVHIDPRSEPNSRIQASATGQASAYAVEHCASNGLPTVAVCVPLVLADIRSAAVPPGHAGGPVVPGRLVDLLPAPECRTITHPRELPATARSE